ncbi:MAG: hypothetical protein IT436_05170 [Phycisphaerales bacterium]|nr:hypothetical protein [Phycisphaerales bacterium]
MSLYAPLLALLETRRLIADLRSGFEAVGVVRAAGDDSRSREEEEEEEERRKRRRIVGEYGGRDPAWFAAVAAAMPPGLPFGGDGGIPPKGVPSGDAGDGSSSTVGNSDAFRNQGLEPWWTQLAGVWVETDVLTHDSGGPPALLWYNQSTAATTTTRSDIGIVVAGDGSQAVGARLSFAGGLLSGYVMRAEVGNHRLYRYDAGVPTLIRTYAGAITAADTMGIFCSGNTIRGRKNATNLASSADATYPTGFTGIISFAAGAQFSSWATNL